MKIIVQFEAQLRQVAKAGEQSLEVADGATLPSVLRQVAQSNAGLKERLLTADGDIQQSLLLFVNERPVPADVADSQTLKDGDRVLLLPPISGG